MAVVRLPLSKLDRALFDQMRASGGFECDADVLAAALWNLAEHLDLKPHHDAFPLRRNRKHARRRVA